MLRKKRQFVYVPFFTPPESVKTSVEFLSPPKVTKNITFSVNFTNWKN